MTMLEKIARAAWISVRGPDDGPCGKWPDTAAIGEDELFRTAARAALLAMREPDDDVVMAGAECVWDEPGRWHDKPPLTEQGEARNAFTAMIDAILAQPSTPTDVTPA